MFRLGEITIPYRVGVARQASPPEVHQQKRQVVQHVGAGDLVVELDAIEQRRPPVDERDVAEVQIAVALPDIPCVATPVEQGAVSFEFGTGVVGNCTTEPVIDELGAVLVDP